MDNNSLIFKRLTIISGHYGSGKTNIAVNIAKKLAESQKNVALADLDIVNPYFRSKDSQRELEEKGIRLICSLYANSNVDIPALPQEMYALTDDKSLTAVLDIGGDDRGALVLGRLADNIKAENNYEMLMVVNKFRPETKDADSAIEIMHEIEAASKIKFTGIINNSNLGIETDENCILSSLSFAEEIAEKTGIPVVMTTVSENVKICAEIPGLYKLKLQDKYF